MGKWRIGFPPGGGPGRPDEPRRRLRHRGPADGSGERPPYRSRDRAGRQAGEANANRGLRVSRSP
ncbi:hypothetical protein, partial [Heyndrickxia coagulans]|uniref:hypothetical protein n=1 Tax=Heyndrickxia coagulans TaxID=1398 RepID=UPI0019D6B52C